MYGLDMEGLLDFSVRRDEEVQENQGGKQKSENRRSYNQLIRCLRTLHRANKQYLMVAASDVSVDPEIWRLPALHLYHLQPLESRCSSSVWGSCSMVCPCFTNLKISQATRLILI
jgi:hypothetical protein